MTPSVEVRAAHTDPSAVAADLLVVPVYQDELGSVGAQHPVFGELGREAEADQFKGRRGEVAVLPTGGRISARRLAFIGLGPRADWRPADLRGTLCAAANTARARGITSVAIALEPVAAGAGAEAVAFAVEGAWYAGYRFDRYRGNSGSSDDKNNRLSQITLLGPTVVAAEKALRRGEIVARAACWARDLVNEPPRVCTPRYLAQAARDIAAEHGLEVEVVEGVDALDNLSMHMLAAVGRGSEEPPVLIHLTYRGPDGGGTRRRVALVGKGVTYDSGGYSMKPASAQIGMHGDMAGAAAVLGAARAIATLTPRDVDVHFIVPSAENLVAHNAFKVNDILRGKNGTTVEIVNTDAEGRLLLGDALAYAEALEVEEIVDIATLTGANVIALGGLYAAVFGDDDAFVERFMQAAEQAGEPFWRMPLERRLEKKMQSPVADIKNSGGRDGSSIIGALFLKRFVSRRTWIHVDMAGLGINDEAWEHLPKGASGFGVATLTRFAAGTAD